MMSIIREIVGMKEGVFTYLKGYNILEAPMWCRLRISIKFTHCGRYQLKSLYEMTK